MQEPHLKIEKDVDLSSFATMHVSAIARFMIRCSNTEELRSGLKFSKSQGHNFLILGGGSNILFSGNFDGVIIRNELKGVEVLVESEEDVIVKIAAGEDWHSFVTHCVENEWGGIENLALIPGTVGAAPIQNIGAYGVELEDVFVELEALNIETGLIKKFDLTACKFGYRDSVFKNELKGLYVITSVTLKFLKNYLPNIEYAALRSKLDEKGITDPSIRDVFENVIEIRESKLPNPANMGNNGSFFKNPIISISLFQKLKEAYPDIPGYPVNETTIKVAAGWLIDRAGWKGYRKGDAGVHEKQALVLVNHGSATGTEILDVARSIQRDIKQKFDIDLEREVNVI